MLAFTLFLYERFHLRPRSLTAVNVDFYFCEFVHHIWRVHEGARRQLVVNAKHGLLLKFGYQLKSAFPQSDRCLITWKKNQPVLSALPVPQTWLDVIAFITVKSGHGIFGLGLLVAFDACLRVSELRGLRGSDILLPEDSRDSGRACGLRLRMTKTGRNQLAKVSDPAVIRVLRALKDFTLPEERVFMGVSRAFFNKLLFHACRVLKLPITFTMHSLRHGRATMKFLNGEHPESIRLEGRWASPHSMETYLQMCASLLLSVACTPEVSSLFSSGPLLRANILRYM